MAKRARLSLRDLEHENKRFLAPASEKEQSILAAAVELLSERGIAGATTAEIARRAGVTERTLFRYFPSKSDLVRRVLFPLLLHAGLARGVGDIRGAAAPGGSGFPILVRGILRRALRSAAGRSRACAYRADRAFAKRRAAPRRRPALASACLAADGRGARAAARARRNPQGRRCRALGARDPVPQRRRYFFTRYVFVPDREWDDAREIEMMADLLAHGCSGRTGERQ